MAVKHFYPKVFLGFLMSALVMLSDVMANTLNNSLIFNRLGTEAFGYMTFCKALSVIAATAIMATLAGRIKKSTLLLGFLMTIVVLGFGAALLNQKHLILAIIFLTAAEGALLVGFNFTIWSIYSDIFAPLVRKKAYPLISAGYGAAGISAGFFIAQSARQYGTTGQALIFTGLVSATMLLAGFLFYLSPTPKSRLTKKLNLERPNQFSIRDSVRKLPSVFTQAPFLRWRLMFIVFVYISYRLTDYQFNIALHDMSKSEERFSELLGFFYSGINIFIFSYEIFLAKGALTRLGLTRIVTLYPTLMIISSIVTIFTPSPIPIIINRGIAEFMLGTVIVAAAALLYNVVVGGVRASAQALIEGLGAALGTIFGSALLICFSLFLLKNSMAVTNNIIVIIVNVGALYTAIQMGKRYVRSALQNLDSDDRQLTLNAIQALQERGHHEAIGKLVQVAVNASSKHDTATTTNAIRTLSQIRHRMMPHLFLRMLSGDSPREMMFAFNMMQDFYLNELRSNFILRQKVLHALESVIHRTATSDDSANTIYYRSIRLYFQIAYPQMITQFLEDILVSNKSRLIANTIEALNYLENKYSYLYIERFLEHSNNRVRSTAIVELWKIREDKENLIFALEEMFTSSDLASRISAIWAVGRVQAVEFIPRILSYTENECPSDSLKMHGVYSVLNFPLSLLTQKFNISATDLSRLYQHLLIELTDLNNPNRARRAVHFTLSVHPTHLRRLDHTVISMELDEVKMAFLRANIIEYGSDAKPLLKFINRFLGSSNLPSEVDDVGISDRTSKLMKIA